MNILNDGEYTFYAANGASIIDLLNISGSITSWNFSRYTDTEIELFTGHPNRGHSPVHVNLDLLTRSNIRETIFVLENGDWDRWRKALEEEASKLPDPANPIYNNPDET